LLLPGISFIYYGEELGMEDHRGISWADSIDPQGCNTNESVFLDYSRDPVRTPMQWDATMNAGFSMAAKTWLPVHPNYQTLNVAAQKVAEQSTFKLYQELIKMRKLHTFSHGGFKSAVTQTSVYTYLRHLEQENSYAVLVNVDNVTRTVNLEQVFSELKEDGNVVLASSQSAFKVGDAVNRTSVVLGQYEAIVVEFKNGATAVTMSVLLLIFSVARLFF
jgi:alpha-glucosidase